MTERQKEVARLLVSGLSTKEAAAKLQTSAKNVEYHRRKIYQLWHVNNPITLLRALIGAGVIDFQSWLCGEI